MTRTLQVSYWQLVDLETGRGLVASGKPIDWQMQISKARGPFNLAGDVSGTRFDTAESARLILARDRSFAHRQRDRAGNASDMPVSAPGNEPIEEAFASFIPDSNAFCFARTSVAAPPASAVGAWLMAQKIPNRRTQLKVDPVIDNDRFRKAREESGSHQASWIDITAMPPDAEARQSSSLFRLLSRVGSDVGDYKIEIRLAVDDDSRQASELRRELFRRAVEVADDLQTDNTKVEKAQVKVLGEVGPIDLIRDRIVYQARAKIKLIGTNRSLNPRAVFDAMDSNFEAHEDRIRRSLVAT